jgi:hypothetical protein
LRPDCTLRPGIGKNLVRESSRDMLQKQSDRIPKVADKLEHFGKRRPHAPYFTSTDWIVIVGYLLVNLLIGLYYRPTAAPADPAAAEGVPAVVDVRAVAVVDATTTRATLASLANLAGSGISDVEQGSSQCPRRPQRCRFSPNAG